MSASIHFYIRTERPHADKSAQIYLLFSLGRNLKTKISLKKNIPRIRINIYFTCTFSNFLN